MAAATTERGKIVKRGLAAAAGRKETRGLHVDFEKRRIFLQNRLGTPGSLRRRQLFNLRVILICAIIILQVWRSAITIHVFGFTSLQFFFY